MTTMTLAEKVVAVHRALAGAAFPHAIGGAVALSIYGAGRPTTDIDVNVFVPPGRRAEVLRALAPLPADGHPVHVFYSHDGLHEEMAKRIRWVDYCGTKIPLVTPEHLIVRKSLLDRPKDRRDIAALLAADPSIDRAEITRWLSRLADS